MKRSLLLKRGQALTLFGYSAEPLIAMARFILAGVALAAIYLDPTQPVRFAQATFLGMSLYAAVSLLIWVIAARRAIAPSAQLLVHGLDVATATGLMYLTEGPTSPFFVFFTFILISATLRWNWRGALATASILVILFVAVIGALGSASEGGANELNRIVVRLGYLLVVGSLLAYFGAHRERSQTRLAQLVAWPGPEGRDDEQAPTPAALAHAANIMGACRVVVIWEEEDEPRARSASWDADGATYLEDEDPDLADVVSPSTFLGRLQPDQVPAKIAGGRDASEWLTAGFQLTLCSGRLYLMDPRRGADDEFLLTSLIALRLGVDLEHQFIRRRLQAAAKLSERAKLARDLHDGLLQTLTASTLHLKLAAKEADPALAKRLIAIQGGLADEQKVIRQFVEENRLSSRGRRTLLRSELEPRLQRLEEEWGCRITFEETEANVLSSELTRHIRHLIAEAVANAVRHGGARKVSISVGGAADGLIDLTIKDDGSGFPAPTGHARGPREPRGGDYPRSLTSRVTEIGGKLSVDSSQTGSTLRIHLPHD